MFNVVVISLVLIVVATADSVTKEVTGDTNNDEFAVRECIQYVT